MRKNGSSWASALVALGRATERGKRGETMTPVPMEFRRPMGFKGPLDFRGRMEMTLTNQFVEYQEPFFGGITLNSKKIVAFSSSFFKVHKAGDAQYLS